MAFIDTVSKYATKLLPPKKESSIPLASGGIGHVMISDHDDMIISKPAIVFHAIEIFFTFLAMACFAATAAFENQWGLAPVAITVFAMFISISGLLLSIVMLAVPVIYDKYDKLVRVARAMREVRVTFILAGAGALGLLIGSFALTISAWTQSGCSDPSTDAHASKGKDFQAALPGFCQTKRAGAVFFWLAFLGWVGTFVVAFLDWRNGRSNRPRDPPFSRPVEPAQAEVHDEDDEASYVSVPRPHAQQQRRVTRDEDDQAGGPPTSPFADHNRYEPAGRPSMDAYGAFSDPPPTGYGGAAPPYSPGMSRTMAYAADPYAAVKASISSAPPRIPTPNMGPAYEGYQGYR